MQSRPRLNFRIFFFSRMSSTHLRERTRLRSGAESEVNPPRQVLSLTLRPEQEPTRRVSWDPRVTEHTQQRVSKCCCVFHKKRLFGESDSDDSSSSSGDDDDHHNNGATANDGCGANDAPGVPDASYCCGHSHAHSHDANEQATDPTASASQMVIKRKKRPKCTKQNCYCGTRFS